MSVLIKNMEMPSGLAERGFVIRGDGRVRTFTGAIINECCAVEVPTLHGRMTNADRIRAMTDEELAEFLVSNEWGHIPRSEKWWLKWLQQEAQA